jgi:hypothetical protein
MIGRPVIGGDHWKAGNDSTVNRPTLVNLPLVTLRIAIGRVVWI